MPSAHTSGGIRLYSKRDVNRLVLIRHLKALGLNLEEIKSCLDALPQDSNRNVRVEHTINLLQKQKDKADEQIAKLTGLKTEVEFSIQAVTKCRTCTAERCPESCPGTEHIL